MKLKKTIIALTCVSVSMALTGCWETESGDKVGAIVKFSQEGAFVRSWEAELIRGNMNSGSGAFGKPFYFTVENTSLIPVVQKAMEENKEVKIHYHKEAVAAPWRSETCYFLDSIEVINH